MNLNALVVGCAVLHFASYAVVCESQESRVIGNNVDSVDDRGDSDKHGRSKRQSYYGMIDREYDEFDSRRCVLKMESSFQQCCISGPKTSYQVQKMWDLKLQCLSDIFGNVVRQGGSVRAPPCDRLNPSKEQVWCIMQCLSKRLNLLDEAGNFIEGPLKNHVRNDLIQDVWQRDTVDNIVELCNIEVRRIDPRERRDPAITSSTCRSTSFRLFTCIWREMMKSCPRHLQSNSLGCLRMRQNLHNYEDINDEAMPPYPFVNNNNNNAGFRTRDQMRH